KVPQRRTWPWFTMHTMVATTSASDRACSATAFTRSRSVTLGAIAVPSLSGTYASSMPVGVALPHAHYQPRGGSGTQSRLGAQSGWRGRRLRLPTPRHTRRPVVSSASFRLHVAYAHDGPNGASGTIGGFTQMTRLLMLLLVCVLAAVPRASAACRWFGTQL